MHIRQQNYFSWASIQLIQKSYLVAKFGITRWKFIHLLIHFAHTRVYWFLFTFELRRNVLNYIWILQYDGDEDTLLLMLHWGAPRSTKMPPLYTNSLYLMSRNNFSHNKCNCVWCKISVNNVNSKKKHNEGRGDLNKFASN